MLLRKLHENIISHIEINVLVKLKVRILNLFTKKKTLNSLKETVIYFIIKRKKKLKLVSVMYARVCVIMHTNVYTYFPC